MSFCCVMGLARNRHTTTRAAPCSERANTNKDAGRLGLLQGRLLRRVERKLLKGGWMGGLAKVHAHTPAH
eukprot:scaffold167094_cov27-Tisochrysis_lutea.AAC.1